LFFQILLGRDALNLLERALQDGAVGEAAVLGHGIVPPVGMGDDGALGLLYAQLGYPLRVFHPARHGAGRGIAVWLLTLNQGCEVTQRDDIDVWERRLPKHVVVAVVGDYISGSGRYGTVHKLIIIRVSLNHFKMIVGRDEFHKGTVDYGLHNQFGCWYQELSSSSWPISVDEGPSR